MKTIKLTEPEINHILSLIHVNEREGWYFGNVDQYWNRSWRIKEKLQPQPDASDSQERGEMEGR